MRWLDEFLKFHKYLSWNYDLNIATNSSNIVGVISKNGSSWPTPATLRTTSKTPQDCTAFFVASQSCKSTDMGIMEGLSLTKDWRSDSVLERANTLAPIWDSLRARALPMPGQKWNASYAKWCKIISVIYLLTLSCSSNKHRFSIKWLFERHFCNFFYYNITLRWALFVNEI